MHQPSKNYVHVLVFDEVLLIAHRLVSSVEFLHLVRSRRDLLVKRQKIINKCTFNSLFTMFILSKNQSVFFCKNTYIFASDLLQHLTSFT